MLTLKPFLILVIPTVYPFNMIVKLPENGFVLLPAERTPFLIQIKLADNVMLFPKTIRFPSIIKVFKTTLVFKINVWVELIVTFDPDNGTVAEVPVPQEDDSFQYLKLEEFGVANLVIQFYLLTPILENVFKHAHLLNNLLTIKFV